MARLAIIDEASPELPALPAGRVAAVSSAERPGDTMFLYTGLRTRAAARIIEPPTCVKVESIVLRTLTFHSDVPEIQVFVGPLILDREDRDRGVQEHAILVPSRYGLLLLADDERERLAIADGFEGFDGMSAFWGANPRFYGHVFHWRLH